MCYKPMCRGPEAEWSGEPVSHPAIVQDGGFDSRHRGATLRTTGASVNVKSTNMYADVSDVNIQ